MLITLRGLTNLQDHLRKEKVLESDGIISKRYIFNIVKMLIQGISMTRILQLITKVYYRINLVRETPGKDARSFTTYGRLKMYTQKMADITRGNPGAHHKIKDRHLQNTTGLNDRNFGFG